ncbi:hypothetical protein [[Bacillus] enclensis]|uniref:hypothetical protein n=1 Tax=[Bacillus] enclensis TaxID=1402860 RepID=UPI0018DB8C64|nr:hypothetical protein [[Bacillus] enclensis]MBH9965581.1 hypothetical protein [[Bacillus] enclensis]
MRSYYARTVRKQRNATFESIDEMQSFFAKHPKFELIEFTDYGDEVVAFYMAP